MKAILTDVTLCIGCERCVDACRMANDLGPQLPFRWLLEDGLSSERWCSVNRQEKHFVRRQCMHCIQPACASACPVGALQKTPEGPVIYDDQKCLGCRYCMMACPFGVPRYSWESPVPLVRKCQMCFQKRVSQGQQPGCTAACPVHATIFGEREELLAEAHRRIQEHPDRYNGKVFGETEVGGTCVLYLAPFDLKMLTLGNPLDDRPMPERTVYAMTAVPPVFLTMGAVMTGIWWVIDRRMQRQQEQAAAQGRKDGEGDSPRDGQEGGR